MHRRSARRRKFIPMIRARAEAEKNTSSAAEGKRHRERCESVENERGESKWSSWISIKALSAPMKNLLPE